MFLSNTNVNKLLAGFVTLVFSKTDIRRNCCNYRNYPFVFLHLFHKVLTCHITIIFTAVCKFRFACFYIERHTPMPIFLFSFSRSIAFSFKCIYMNNYRMIYILNFFKCFYQIGNIISVCNIDIIKSHSFEQITFTRSV